MREMKPSRGLFAFIWAVVIVLSLAGSASALPLFSDGFEGYAVGTLDMNRSGGPNASPNGTLGGNPWFGPAPPNAQVIGTDSGVSPHSGNYMIRGRSVTGPDYDQNWYNLAYRLNSGQAFTGNIQLDWWFYDVAGAGDTNYRDYAALCYYDTAPSNTDYPGSGNLTSGAAQVQRISLGAPYYSTTGYNSTFYQARILNAIDGYDGTAYFNTATQRTPGWHHGRIVVGPALANNTNDVGFYIDDMQNVTFTHNSVTPWGYNVIELNTKSGSQTAYFDDVSFSVTPEPATLLLLGASALFLRRRGA